MNKNLHIICLNIPYPVDYGGAFDLFYKLLALKQQGVKIHLHCFQYGRPQQPELNRYCESVNYYKRKTGLLGLSLRYPYIVSSRNSKKLLNTLIQDNYPILMEGIHCTYFLNDKRFKQRMCFVRLHNVEYVYYKYLYKNTSSLFKKMYFYWESKVLRLYEKSIAKKAAFWSVTEKDAEFYRKIGCIESKFLPLFLPDWKVKSIEGKGTFCLYHGDLSVSENEKAVVWLIKRVFNDLQIPFVIAGKNPSPQIWKLLHNKNTTCLIANPEEQEMQDLISKAHINVIPSYNSTGIKLKLINALFNGRHCLVNEQTVEGTNLKKVCHVALKADVFKSKIIQLYSQPFSQEDSDVRRLLLDKMFNNEVNAKQVVEWIWG